MLRRLRSILRVLRNRGTFESGMADELRFHLEEHTADLIKAGVSPEEAARRARIEFGTANTVREECRISRRIHLFDELQRQFRHAARTLRRTPRFTLTALFTLAVCIGANLTIFAVVNAILLRPLPFPESGSLVTIYNTYPNARVLRDGSSTTNYYERRGRIAAFSGLSIYREFASIVGNPGATEQEQAIAVSPEFFSTLGTGPAIGRTFTEEEMSPQAEKTVILSDNYWRQHFQADPHIAGKQLRVDGVNRTIIAVLPPSFRFLSSEARLYFPYTSRPEDRTPRERHSGGNVKQLIARLRPGATVAQAQARIDAQDRALAPQFPRAEMIAQAGFRSVVTPLQADHVASIRPTLLWMQGGALTLLLIGTVNLANLLLIRAAGRMKELAVRQALGAGRFHVVTEVLVETSLLTTGGALLGLAFGWAGIHLLSTLGADQLPLGSRIVIDARLAAVAMFGAVILGLALALPIAWFHLRARLSGSIQSEARGGVSGRLAQSLRYAFIVAQIALALVLLSGAGLLRLSLQQILAVSPGFQPDHLLTARIALPGGQYRDRPARLGFNERLLRAVAAQPGVLSAGIVSNIPVSGDTGKSSATVKGRPHRPGEIPRARYSYGVDGDYFTAMGFSLVEGRFLTAADSRRSEPYCVIDQDFATYYWPNQSAIGQQLFAGSEEGKDGEAFTIVGVVGAVKQAGLTDDAAQGAVYYPFAAGMNDRFYFVTRTSLTPNSLVSALRDAVRQTDPGVTLYDLRSMDDRIAGTLTARRAPALLAEIVSFIALLLTAIGTYGILGYAVAQRRREIAVRIALGARPQQIRGQFLSLAVRLLIAGTALGLTGAWLTGRALRSLLFRVPPFHMATLAGAALVIAAVALAACLIPSQRAARISPMEALAEE